MRMIQTYHISNGNNAVTGQISLPASKSISNRLLVMDALSGGRMVIKNLSESDDTRVLVNALSGGSSIKDAGLAGTAMRFLAAYLAVTPGKWKLTGANRLKERPIGALVEALQSLGAEIYYPGRTGYPPLEISGRELNGGYCRIESGVSSQFITALLMVAPVLEKGLKLELSGEVISSSYIRLTLALMQQAGIRAQWENRFIFIAPQSYQPSEFHVEPDWSAASYWYSAVCLADSADLFIDGLRKDDLQGDAVLPSLFDDLGVHTEFREKGIRLTKKKRSIREFYFDFRDHPDLVQTMVVVCGLTGIPFRMDGTQTLRIKETDRVKALKDEMSRLGVRLAADADGRWITWDGVSEGLPPSAVIDTYNDHRMAMAFAPAAMVLQKVGIRDPMVVNKSYPGFWSDMKKAGFQMT